MDENDLTGSVPDLFVKTPRLEELQLYKNKFSGPLPPSIGKLDVLRVLYMDSNEFSGSIPTSYGQLNDLATLYLYNNELTGSIPSTVGGMKDLKDFRIYQNHLTGSLPSEIGMAFNLGKKQTCLEKRITQMFVSSGQNSHFFLVYNTEILYVQDNAMTGTIPEAVGELDHLKSFRFYRNSFSGVVPQSVCKLTTEYHLIFLAGDCDEDTGTIQCDCCHECSP